MNTQKTPTLSPLVNKGEEPAPKQKPEPAVKTEKRGVGRKNQASPRPPIPELLVMAKKQLHYDPITDVITWKVSPIGWIPSGTVAGTPSTQGYISIVIGGFSYRAHRLAWLLMTGEMPVEIDHINQKKADNRWANLRSVTRQQNMMNKPAYRKKSDLPTGVYQDKRKSNGKRYGTQLQFEGKRYYFGFHKTPEEAGKAFLTARALFFKEFAPQPPEHP